MNIKKIIQNIVLIGFVLLLPFNSCLAIQDLKPEKPQIKKSITIVKNQAILNPERYLISPGDTLSFSVYDAPEFDQAEITVRPDGYATILPMGEVFVAGYDVSSLTEMFNQKMIKFLNYPQVSLGIREFHPASVYIYGAVQKPGTYHQVIQADKGATDTKNPTVKTDLTISNVISNAGGINFDADLRHIKIKSVDSKEREVDLWKLIKEGDVSQNSHLRSGDVVYVPQIETVPPNDADFKLLTNTSIFPIQFPVRVIGDVQKSGLFYLPSESPYLNTAIASAQGYTLDANKKVLTIYRKSSSGKLSKIYVDPAKVDFVLRPNDLVEVKGRKLLKVVRAARYIADIINPANVMAAAYNNWAEVFDPTRRFERL